MNKNDKQYESLKAKLKKLLALAERGYRGEADNARRILEKLCQENGVSLEDVMCETKPKRCVFDIGRGKLYQGLFIQCFAKVTGKKEMTYRQLSRSQIVVELTPLEFAELNGLFAWHKAHFECDLEDLKQTVLEAYVNKHNLFRDTSGEEEDFKPLTPERLEKLRKLMAIQASLSDETYTKMIENK